MRNWTRRPPEGHPEFEFGEALELPPDPDDPETFIKHGGGIEEEIVYEDDKIVVFYPRDQHAFNWHLRRAGRPEINAQNWANIKHDDIFVIVGKEPSDLLGRDGKRELGIVYGDGTNDLTAWKSNYNDPASLKTILADPTYGRSVRRMLLRFYKDQGRDDAAPIFLQVGGPRALRRAGARGQVDMNQWSTTLGLHYVKQKKYKLAANAFGRDPSTVTAKGVFLRFDNLNELAELFDNSKAATEVFDQEIYHWFDGYPMPDVKDVTEFLTPKAIQHIRSVMVNREVWYPDGGPDGQGALVMLTTPLLNEVDDATIIDWLENPNDEDGDVFEDITDAIQHAGFRMIESVGSDEYYTGYIKAALKAFDGTEYKYVDHPIKKGADMFQVFVPWGGIVDAFQKYMDDNGEVWTGDLEELVLKTYRGTVEGPDVQPGMWDVKDAMAKSPGWIEDFMDPIYELDVPEQPEAPGQEQLPLGEGLDDPAAMPDMLSGIRPKAIGWDMQTGQDEHGKERRLFVHRKTGLSYKVLDNWDGEFAVYTYDKHGQFIDADFFDAIGMDSAVAQAHGLALKMFSGYSRKMGRALAEGLDDPEAMPDMLSGVPAGLPARLRKDLDVYAKEWGLTIHDFTVTFEFEPHGSSSYLKVAFKPEGAWIERDGVMAAHAWDQVASHLTGNIVRAYTDTWAVMNGYFCDEAPSGNFVPPGYVWIIWPMHKRKDPGLPF